MFIMNIRAFIYGFTWTQRFRISIWDLLEQFNKVWFLTVNCWKINYLNDKTKIAYLFVLICSCTEIHYKILRASASMKRENNCMCKRTLSQENLILHDHIFGTVWNLFWQFTLYICCAGAIWPAHICAIAAPPDTEWDPQIFNPPNHS